jgi:hypothetical protein
MRAKLCMHTQHTRNNALRKRMGMHVVVNTDSIPVQTKQS